MKHLFSSFSALTLAAILIAPFAACDDIDEADRIIAGKPEKHVVKPETITTEYQGESFTYVHQQRLLIEDFTGWKCVNCPAIADFLTYSILPIYPSVMVSLHMTTNSFSAGHRDGYNCAAADQICDQINGSPIASQLSLPSVCLNNVSFGNSRFSNDTVQIADYAQRLYVESLSSTSYADIAINAHKGADDKYEVCTYINAPAVSTGSRLQLWLIEEELISSMQQSSTGWIRNYKNHGILREVLNGDCSGEPIQTDAEGATVIKHTIDLTGKSYIPANCRVVAIVLKGDGVTVDNCCEAALE